MGTSDGLTATFGRALLIVGLLNLVFYAAVLCPNQSAGLDFSAPYQRYGALGEPPLYVTFLLSLAAAGLPVVAFVMGEPGRRMTIGHLLAYELIIFCVLFPPTAHYALDDWGRLAAVPAVGALLQRGSTKRRRPSVVDEAVPTFLSRSRPVSR